MQNLSSQSPDVQTTLDERLKQSLLIGEERDIPTQAKNLNKLKLDKLKFKTKTSDSSNRMQIQSSIDSIVTKANVNSVDTSTESVKSINSLKELDKSKLWADILKSLSNTLDSKIISAWLKPISILEVTSSEKESGTSITLLAPNKFSIDHIRKNYLNSITKLFSLELKTEKITVVLKESKSTAIPASNKASKVEAPEAPIQKNLLGSDDKTNLSLNYNFSNFVVGSCNQFAHAACSKVAESPGTSYNPLLIYGGVGLGKTHLANAIGNAARRRRKKVLLVSSEYFVSELIASLKTNSMERFRAKFRTLDVLIIDDIQFIIGKERTQEEFFHTFNELYGKNKQVIITSDKLPQDLIGLEERLRTRFQSGLSVDLQAPDFETRVAILTNKCEQTDLKIPEEVLKLIAVRIDTNVRELEGALTRLQALCNLLGEKPSLELAQKVLDTISPQKSRELTTDFIKEVVAKEFNVSIQDLAGKRRTQNIALARQVAMYLCRKYTARSFPEIGALFGGRDHSTVIHAIKSITDRMPLEEFLRGQIEKIIVRLES